MGRLWDALTRSSAETEPTSPDPRLRGRTYAIPFQHVWESCLALAEEGARWTVTSADDEAGVIRVECRTLVFGLRDHLRIDVGLDVDGQTRVDLRATALGSKRDLGRNARRIGAFVRRLDQALQAGPHQILDATRTPSWSS